MSEPILRQELELSVAPERVDFSKLLEERANASRQADWESTLRFGLEVEAGAEGLEKSAAGARKPSSRAILLSLSTQRPSSSAKTR